jgi:hypothetical protein
MGSPYTPERQKGLTLTLTKQALRKSFCKLDSPTFVEEEFCELRLYGVLRSSLRVDHPAYKKIGHSACIPSLASGI